MKFKLNWYFCANTTDIVKNFVVIKSASIKSFHCILFGPRPDKTSLRGLQQSETQTSLLSYKD